MICNSGEVSGTCRLALCLRAGWRLAGIISRFVPVDHMQTWGSQSQQKLVLVWGLGWRHRAADLGQSHKEGPDVCAEVACRRQVPVHLPALPKLLQPVVKLARHHHLHTGRQLSFSTLREALQWCLRACMLKA